WLKAIVTNDESVPKDTPLKISDLTLQLYPAGYFGGTNEQRKYSVRADIPAILTTVVINQPDRLIVATNQYLKECAVQVDKTFAILIERLKKDTPYPVDFITLAGSSETLVAVIHGEDITTASHALVLSVLYPQLVGEQGALVGIPQRYLLVVKRLDSKPPKELTGAFGTLIRSMGSGQAGFISDQAYSFNEGIFRVAH